MCTIDNCVYYCRIGSFEKKKIQFYNMAKVMGIISNFNNKNWCLNNHNTILSVEHDTNS